MLEPTTTTNNVIIANHAIDLDESSYGATQSVVIVISAKSKAHLRKAVKQRNFRVHDGDRPGQIYAYSCRVLRYIKGDSCWQAVCISSSHWDI